MLSSESAIQKRVGESFGSYGCCRAMAETGIIIKLKIFFRKQDRGYKFFFKLAVCPNMIDLTTIDLTIILTFLRFLGGNKLSFFNVR